MGSQKVRQILLEGYSETALFGGCILLESGVRTVIVGVCRFAAGQKDVRHSECVVAGIFRHRIHFHGSRKFV